MARFVRFLFVLSSFFLIEIPELKANQNQNAPPVLIPTSYDLIHHVKYEGNANVLGIEAIQASNAAKIPIATFDNGEPVTYGNKYFSNEFIGKYWMEASDSNGSFWFEYDADSQKITKRSDLPGSNEGMAQFPHRIKSMISEKDDGSIHIGENSAVFKEENGREKFWAQDANGKSIPIDITNGSKLLINGRDVEQSINNVGALSAALTGLPTVPTDTTLACGLGTGTHGGDFAFSGGCASKVNDKLSINYAASMTMPGQDYAGDFEDKFSARAGFVWKLGKSVKPSLISMKDKQKLTNEITGLKNENKNLNEKITKFETEKLELLARLERLEKIALNETNSSDLATIKLP